MSNVDRQTIFSNNLLYLRQMRDLNNPESLEIAEYIANHMWDELPVEILAEIDVQRSIAYENRPENVPATYIYSNPDVQGIYQQTYNQGIFDKINLNKIGIITLLTIAGIFYYVTSNR